MLHFSTVNFSSKQSDCILFIYWFTVQLWMEQNWNAMQILEENKQKINRSAASVGNISEMCFFLFWLKWWLFWKNIFINPNEQRGKTALHLSALEWKGEFYIEKMKQDVKVPQMKPVF